MVKFYKCAKCGQILTVFEPKCPGITCCGESVKELNANTSDGATEKHVPAVELNGDVLTVKVGSVPHPMEADHYIPWIFVETENGGLRQNLSAGEEPKAVFALNGKKPVAVYEFCNKHGLWKKDL